MRTCKKISEDERIGEQEVEIWKEFFTQMLYQRMKIMEGEEMKKPDRKNLSFFIVQFS